MMKCKKFVFGLWAICYSQLGVAVTHSDATIGENAKSYNDEQGYPVPSHASGKIGAINNVYGGGNEARVIGADIRGNVFGGGNEAEVTGNTNVNIGKKAE